MGGGLGRGGAWRAVAIGAALALSLGAGRAAAHAPVTMVYDEAAVVERLAAPGGLPVETLWQQQPSTRVLRASRQAWKVSGNHGSPATPGIRGRSAPEIASLLRERIRRSGARMVFVDEVGAVLGRHGAASLATALAALSRETLPGDAVPLSRRVHLYVQHRPALFRDPGAWAEVWRALAFAGGVWWQTYGSAAVWNEQQWATWPALISAQLERAGGDPGGLRWVVRGHASVPVEQQLGWATGGAACAVTLRGVAAYRLGAEAEAFRERYGAIMAGGPAGCRPGRVPEDREAVWRGLAALEAGARLPGGALVTPRRPGLRPGEVAPGRPGRVRVSFGPDPLAIARALGAEPEAFWGAASPVLVVEGPGVRRRIPLVPGRARDVVLAPRAGAVSVTLQISGRAVREALGAQGADLLEPLAAEGAPATEGLRGRLAAAPAAFVLRVPLLAEGVRPALLARRPRVGARPPARIAILVPGPPPSARATRRVVVLRVRDRAGAPLAGARVLVREPRGRRRAARTDARGQARLRVTRGPRPLVVTAAGARASRLVR